MATSSGAMNGKICMVTGATSGIGRVTARRLAEMGARVILVGRNSTRGAAALAEIRRETGNSAVEFLCADLSSQAQIHALAADYRGRYPRLDVLVNNAGALFGRRQLSADGIEMTFALNHLGYFLLSHLLLPTLEAAAPSRIVNVASQAHRGTALDFDDLQSERRYRGLLAYKRSKLANLLFTYELARRLKGTGVTANALHPGFVASGIGINHGWTSRSIWRLLTLFAISLDEGANTSVFLASSPEVDNVSGEYFIKCRPARSSEISYDAKAARRLWEISAELTNL